MPPPGTGRDLLSNTLAILSVVPRNAIPLRTGRQPVLHDLLLRHGCRSAPPRQTFQAAALRRQPGKLVLVRAHRSREVFVREKRPVQRAPAWGSANRCSPVRKSVTPHPPARQAWPALSCDVRSRATAKEEPRKKNGSFPRRLPRCDQPVRFAVKRTSFSRGSRAA